MISIIIKRKKKRSNNHDTKFPRVSFRPVHFNPTFFHEVGAENTPVMPVFCGGATTYPARTRYLTNLLSTALTNQRPWAAINSTVRKRGPIKKNSRCNLHAKETKTVERKYRCAAHPHRL